MKYQVRRIRLNICYFFFFVKLNFDNNIDKKRNVKKIIFNIYVINYSILNIVKNT